MPTLDVTLAGQCTAVGLAFVAAVTDWRKGEIPNWLTYPPLVIGPLVWGLTEGFWGLASSVGGMAACAFVPWLLWKLRAIGGGDLKLVAAMGAVAGLTNGLEFELAGFVVAALYAFGRLAYEGKLFRTLSNSVFLALNPLMPKSWRRRVPPSLMSTVRMGGAFFVGASVSVLSHYPELWS